ncbi:hypothetical protein C6P76_13900 [Burkholderia multivorans]|nr:hypothetical protein C6P76_13900 [Burkholderia multivorans]
MRAARLAHAEVGVARIRTKTPISEAVRREVARRYGVLPGSCKTVQCAYCDALGQVQWFVSYHRPGLGRVALFNLEFDHVKPEARGGRSVARNIVLACRPCNRTKGARSAREWQS